MPALRNTIVATLIMVFVFALGSYLLPQILGRPQHWTLSVLITDQAIYQSNMPFAAAMAVFLVLVTLALVGLTLLVGRKGEARMSATLLRRALSSACVGAVPGRAADRRRRRLGQREAGRSPFRRRASRSPGTAQIFTDPGMAARAVRLGDAGDHCRRRWRWRSRLPLAWFLWRRIAPWANVFQLLGIAPFILPPVITALGILTFWATTGFYGAAVDGRRSATRSSSSRCRW